MDAMAPDAQLSFAEGVVARALNPVDRRFTGGSISNLKKLADSATGTGALRQMFPDAAAADAFIIGIQGDLGAAQLAKMFRDGALLAVGAGSAWALGRSSADVFQGTN